MEKIVIEGKATLSGEVKISGAKNAVLPIMTAALMGNGSSSLTNVPNLKDTRTMIELLEIIGAKCNFKNGSIKTKNIIFATNGFLKSLGIKSNYNFPITLTASMTRSLTDQEFRSIGEPKEWGVLPVRPMGATIRMTKDRRILIRNTAEFYNPFQMSQSDLNRRKLNQKKGIKKKESTL